MSNSIPTPILTLVNNRPVVSSFKVAEHFKKRHDHVLRDIKNLILEAPECAPNFGLTSVLGAYKKHLTKRNS